MSVKKRVFLIFDVDHDEFMKNALVEQAKSPDSPFDIIDTSIKEPLGSDWKNKVRRRMDNVDVAIVLCGASTHKAAGVAAELEIALEKRKDYFLLGAYTDRLCTKPSAALSSDKVYRWTWENVKGLVCGAR